MGAVKRVLITDDEQDLRWVLSTLLKQQGYVPFEAVNGRAALRILAAEAIDLMILDLRLPGADGLEVLRESRRLHPDLPVVMLTGHGNVPTAVEAMRAGAYSFLLKPFRNEDILKAIASAVDKQRTPTYVPLRVSMGPSPAIAQVHQAVERVAPTDFTVLIEGETGTGKELVAHAIHGASKRISGPFIAVDCGAIPHSLIESELFGHEKGAFTGAEKRRLGCLEQANGGTLFLDEVGNLPSEMQAKLLRALQEKQIRRLGGTAVVRLDLRVIAATNADLADLAKHHKFRADLLYRLDEFRLSLPTLRERPNDIPYLAERFAQLTAQELDRPTPILTPEALARLQGYPWPGNVRELRNVIRRAVLLAEDRIEPSLLNLPQAPRPERVVGDGLPIIDGHTPLKELLRPSVAALEREIVARALKQANGNKAQAARLLHVDYKTIRTKAKEYGLSDLSGDDDHE